MNLIKLNPFLPVSAQFENTFDSFLNRSLTDIVGSDFVNEMALANVKDTEDALLIEIAAPGYSKEDFEINVEDNVLRIKAGKQLNEEKQVGKFTRREFKFESFSRNFTLDKNIDAEQISASYEAGILSVNLPKLKILETKSIEVS